MFRRSGHTATLARADAAARADRPGPTDSDALNGCHGYGAKGDLGTENAQPVSDHVCFFCTARYSGPLSLFDASQRTLLGTDTAGDHVPSRRTRCPDNLQEGTSKVLQSPQAA